MSETPDAAGETRFPVHHIYLCLGNSPEHIPLNAAVSRAAPIGSALVYQMLTL
jgi:hypothetical protein